MRVNQPSDESLTNTYLQSGIYRPGKRKAWTLLEGEENSPANFKMAIVTGEDGESRITPRHHHNFEQIRHSLSGEYSVGKDRELKEGWVGYFPESAYYGPQEHKSDLLAVALQFGGPSGYGYHSLGQNQKAFDALIEKGGAFEKGIYSWIDEDGQRHQKDSAEALYEEITGAKAVYPDARFSDLVLMNPENYSWVKDESQPGVQHKHLGRFTERDVRVGFVRLEKDAAFQFGTKRSVELLLVKTGAIHFGDRDWGYLSAFGSFATDPVETLVAKEESDLYYVKLPSF